MITDRQPTLHAKLAAWEIDESLSAGSATSGVRVVSTEEREARFGQSPATLLFTGLSGSGKSTIARGVERALFDLGRTAFVLDGEILRSGLSNDLGFTVSDRAENLRRSAHIARWLNDSGAICLLAMVAPGSNVRSRAADVVGHERFLVVHCDAPLEISQQRDPRAERPGRGEQIDADYEEPTAPDLRLPTADKSIDECVELVMDMLRQRKMIR